MGVLSIADAVAQRLVKPDPRRICYASEPDYADNARAMYRHLLETRHGLEHVWLLRDMSLAEQLRADFDRAASAGHVLRVEPWGMRSYLTFLRASRVFHTHGLFGFARPRAGRRTISLWHGMPVKAIRRLHAGNSVLLPIGGSHHVASSSFFRYVVASAFGADPATVLVSGLPRNDVLKGFLPPEHDREEIAARLGLRAHRPWLLWMPTHRSEPDFRGTAPARNFLEATNPALVDALVSACRDADVELVVKLHVLDTLNDSEVALPGPAATVVHSAHWQALGIALYDLVAASDGLVTDISSIFIDYLHTRRPIGVLGFDPGMYTRDTVFSPEVLLRCDAASDLASEEDVARFVRSVEAREVCPVDTDDTAKLLNEDGELCSAEVIACAVGL